MKKAVKAALLSALVYPGVGHFYLKKTRMAVIFICAFTIPLYFIFLEIMARAEHIVEKINKGEIALNITAISASLSNATQGVEAQTLNIPVYVLLMIWFAAIIHAYRLGLINN